MQNGNCTRRECAGNTPEEQMERVREAAKAIVPLIWPETILSYATETVRRSA